MSIENFRENKRVWIAIGSTVAVGVAYLMTRTPGGNSKQTSIQEALATQRATATEPANIEASDGQLLKCLRINSPDYPLTFEPTLPIVKTSYQAIGMLGDTTPPFYIGISGSKEPPTPIDSISDQLARVVANGKIVCVDEK